MILFAWVPAVSCIVVLVTIASVPTFHCIRKPGNSRENSPRRLNRHSGERRGRGQMEAIPYQLDSRPSWLQRPSVKFQNSFSRSRTSSKEGGASQVCAARSLLGGSPKGRLADCGEWKRYQFNSESYHRVPDLRTRRFDRRVLMPRRQTRCEIGTVSKMYLEAWANGSSCAKVTEPRGQRRERPAWPGESTGSDDPARCGWSAAQRRLLPPGQARESSR